MNKVFFPTIQGDIEKERETRKYKKNKIYITLQDKQDVLSVDKYTEEENYWNYNTREVSLEIFKGTEPP